MPQVQLSDELFKEAQRRASESGFASIDEYVAEILSTDLNADVDNLDHLFTPQVIAQLDEISAQIQAGGKTYTVQEVQEHLERKRQEWPRKNAG
jgi:2-keto-3-deoxy-L-rhamnonate aldolase RhmA